MIKALIFDFDGLILDTEGPEFVAWQEIFSEHGFEWPLSMWQQEVGHSSTLEPGLILQKWLGKPLDQMALKKRHHDLDHELIAEQSILPGVEDYLSETRQLGLKLGLASNSPHEWVDGHLQRLGLFDRFDVISCRDDVDNVGKPNPDVYLFALDKLGVRADEAIALEDSPLGSLSAHRAGVRSVVVPNLITTGMTFPHAAYQLTSMADMPLAQLIAKINNE